MKAIGLFGCLALLTTFTSGVKIHCIYYIEGYWDIGPFYSCGAFNISLENPTTVTGISGAHMAGKHNADVKGFYINNFEYLTTIPRGLENYFPSLELLQWFGGSISLINSGTFQPFRNLSYVELSRNKLVTLDGNLFQHTPKLRHIHFSNNLLAHVGHGLLTTLTDLTAAEFHANPCVDTAAHTPDQIQDLNLHLPIKCSTLDTTSDRPTTTISTTPVQNDCPISCTSNEETRKMKNRMKKIERQMRDDLSERILELEKQMRELSSDPRS